MRRLRWLRSRIRNPGRNGLRTTIFSAAAHSQSPSSSYDPTSRIGFENAMAILQLERFKRSLGETNLPPSPTLQRAPEHGDVERTSPRSCDLVQHRTTRSHPPWYREPPAIVPLRTAALPQSPRGCS